MRYYFFISCMVLVSMTYADGLISVEGKFINCKANICDIKTGRQVYTIDLKKNSKAQQIEFKSKKAGDAISSTFVMSSVLSVVDVK